MPDDEFEDLYAVLRIPGTATQEEISRAYKFEINYWHPDKYVGRDRKLAEEAAQMAVRINRAFELLSDPDRRVLYDELYAEWVGSSFDDEQDWDKAFKQQGDIRVLLEREKGLKVVDKRPKGGCLWVVGGRELNDLMEGLAAKGHVFTFTPRGSKATGSKPAWFIR